MKTSDDKTQRKEFGTFIHAVIEEVEQDLTYLLKQKEIRTILENRDLPLSKVTGNDVIENKVMRRLIKT
ncbi:MAG: hypothetical protein LBS55_05620 [Prevotellaceae bacterium]|jgi:hypothetical protein|nr:hypothetical protein [Prevotellaceae bacterium]